MLGSRTTISADRGGYAAGRDIIGIQPEQISEILKAVIDPLVQLNAAQMETIAQLEHQLGATQEQILGFFRLIGEADIQPEAIPDRLVEITERYHVLLAEAEAVPGDNPETARLEVELHATLERLDLERADTLLGEILMVQDRDIERRVLQGRGHLRATRRGCHDPVTLS
jgi:hypothetical protein